MNQTYKESTGDFSFIGAATDSVQLCVSLYILKAMLYISSCLVNDRENGETVQLTYND